MKIRPVETECCPIRTGRRESIQTVTKLVTAVRNFAKEPKKRQSLANVDIMLYVTICIGVRSSQNRQMHYLWTWLKVSNLH